MTVNPQHLFAGVRTFVDDHCRIRRGEEVLVLSDTSVDPTVIEVFAEAARSLGGRVSTMVMPYEEIRLATVEDRFPPAVKAAMCGTDVILLVALGIIAHYHPSVRPFVTAMLEHGARLVFAPGDAEIMASEFSRFPFELVKGIGDWVFQRWARGSTITMTDRNGTDFRCAIIHRAMGGGPAAGVRVRGANEPGVPGTFVTPAAAQGPMHTLPKASGVAVFDEIEYPGFLSQPLRWEFESRPGDERLSWVRRIEGGVEADRLREVIERLQHAGWQAANLFSEIQWGLSPKMPFRTNPLYGKGYHGMAMTRRAGVVHFGIGSPPSRAAGNLAEAAPLHTHGHIFFPTMMFDAEPIIIDGHLVALDDPQIQKLAERFGDPKALLMEVP